MPVIGSAELTNLSGSASLSSVIGMSASLDILHDGTGNEDGWIQFTEVSASANPDENKGRLYCSNSAGTTGLYFRDNAGSESNLISGGGGTDRYVVSRRHYVVPSTTGRLYLMGSVGTTVKQFWTMKSLTLSSGVISLADADHISRHGGPTWQAPRDCTLTKISAAATIYDSSASGLRIHVLHATPSTVPEGTRWDSNVVQFTFSGSLDLKNGDYESLVPYNTYIGEATVVTSSFKAGDAAVIAYEAVPIAISKAWVNVTLEFTAD